jgi:uncharacterized repeat protein (TIGR02543 family)
MRKKAWFFKNRTVSGILGVMLVFGMLAAGCPTGNEVGPEWSYSYKVSFDKNGGVTEASPAAKIVEAPATTVGSLPTPPTNTTADKTVFQGWYTQNGTDDGNWGAQFLAATKVSADITVYAKWGSTEPTTCKVTFNAEGGTGSPADITVNSGSTLGAALPTPVKPDYVFGGWYTAANGGGTAFTGTTTVTDDITVYAKWTTAPINNTDTVSILNVDYNGVNNAVFFDFSTGTRTVMPHDFFDIAIDAGGNIIANSGSYGSGLWVYKTDSDDIADDFSSQQDNVKEYTFKAGETKLYGYQSEANPLGNLTSSKVCLVKVQHKTGDTAAYFKVVFGMTMAPTQSFNMTVVPGLASGDTGKVEINAAITGITAGYGWLYFKLVGTGGPRVLNNGTTWIGGGAAAPKAADWDILATRTNELQSTNGTTIEPDMPVAGRSSVLLNTYKTVQAKTVAGKWIDEVTNADLSDTGLSAEIDAIGYSWYSMAGMPPTFSVAKNTYIIKTVEGKFAKFQPETFYGPKNESFYMDFAYEYDGSGQGGGGIDKTALTAKIDEATAAKTGVVEAANAGEVAQGTQWVSPETMGTFEAAITAAQTVAGNASATQAQVDAEVSTLTDAINTFNAAKQEGTKTVDAISHATLNVDYSGANNAVFFDFSSGTVTELPHDFFDIAIDSTGNIIANSGSYGSGVQVYKTEETDITADLSAQSANVKEYTFKTGTSLYNYQTEVNPLGKLGMTASKVCLVKVQHKTGDTAAYFKVVFSMTMGPTQSFNMTVVPGLASGETDKKEIKAAITGLTAGYGWLYFKLVGTGGPRVLNNGTAWTEDGTAAPKAADWDILATRTNELQTEDGTTVSSQMPVASRSSVLLNTYKTVQAKAVTGKSLDQVLEEDLSEDGLSGEIDAIGYGWYSTGAGMPPTYSVLNNTYVIKTVEGDFAKFQPKTFAKDGKSFVMDFDYAYESGE